MRATLMYRAGDVRIEKVPDARLIEPTDAVITITAACICGSDLWPYKELEPIASGRPMGHEAIGRVEAIGKDVCRIKVGDLVVMPLLTRTGPVNFVMTVSTLPVCMGASSGSAVLPAALRRRPSGFRRLMALYLRFPSRQTAPL